MLRTKLNNVTERESQSQNIFNLKNNAVDFKIELIFHERQNRGT